MKNLSSCSQTHLRQLELGGLDRPLEPELLFLPKKMSCFASQSGLTEPCSLLLLPAVSPCTCTGREMLGVESEERGKKNRNEARSRQLKLNTPTYVEMFILVHVNVGFSCSKMFPQIFERFFQQSLISSHS